MFGTSACPQQVSIPSSSMPFSLKPIRFSDFFYITLDEQQKTSRQKKKFEILKLKTIS